MKFQFIILDMIDPIEYQAMQMNVEISSWAEALDKGDRASLCITPLESGLFGQKS